MNIEIFKNLPELFTENLKLRKCTENDIEFCYELAKDKEMSKYVSWQAHKTLDDSAAFISGIIEGYKSGNCETTWAVCDRQTDKFMGVISLVNFSEKNRSCAVNYWIGRKYQNMGYMTQALKAVIDFGFNTVGLHRIVAKHRAQNLPSGRVMIKAGMNLEGIFHDEVCIDGEYFDVLHYAIINKKG